MSEVQDRTTLLAEQGLLRARLQSLPAAAALTRRSMEARARMLDDALAALPKATRAPARARLTFDGRPVIGTHGVFADFGAKAMGRFSDAIATVAAPLTAPLAAMGPIPGREQNQMLITNVALGSFGFELEEHDPGQIDVDNKTPVALALEKTRQLLEGAAVADDEGLADAAAELDPRALDKVRGFVETLADNDAVCSLYVGDHVFRFTDPGQVRRSLERLSADNLQERAVTLQGEFEGVLPARRTFQFHAGQEVMVGKIGPKVSDPNRINSMLFRPVTVQVLVTQVGGGRPRYTLVDLPEVETALGGEAPLGSR